MKFLWRKGKVYKELGWACPCVSQWRSESTVLVEKTLLWDNGCECDSLFPFSSGEMN